MSQCVDDITATLPVREGTWFASEQSAPQIVRIWEPAVEPLLQANIWHITGARRDLVVDAGLGIGSLRGEFPVMFSGDPLLVLTHAHLDHAGGAHEFEDIAFGAPEQRMLDERYPGGLVAAQLGKALGLHDSALLRTANGLMISEAPAPGYNPADYRMQSFTPTLLPIDGETIDIGELAFTTMLLPGHSPGSIALFEPERSWLFSGDVLYDGLLLDDTKGADPAAYRVSLERILQTDPAIVFPGHGLPMERSVWRSVIERHLQQSRH